MVKIKRTYKTSVFEDVEKLDRSHITDGNVKRHRYYGKLFGCSLETELAKPNCHMTPQLHSWTFIPDKGKLIFI